MKIIKITLIVAFVFVVIAIILGSQSGYKENNAPKSSTTSEKSDFSPTLQPTHIDVTIKNTKYTLTGDDEEEILQQVRNIGPKNEDGERFFAYTNWYVQWKYTYGKTSKGCSAENIRVPVEITYTMPDWNPPTSASTELINKWNNFRMNLQLHEDGHKDFGVRAGEEIYTKLDNLPTAATCNQLDRNVENTAQEIMEKYRRIERKYDVDTNHGRTQGAYFE